MNPIIVGIMGVVIMVIAFKDPLMELVTKIMKLVDEREEKKRSREPHSDLDIHQDVEIKDLEIKNNIENIK